MMDFETKIKSLGLEIWEEIHTNTPGIFNSEYWQGQVLEWVMKDPSFKVDMFRFVDVLPVCETTDQISKHIKEYLLRDNRDLPELMEITLKAASKGLTASIAAKMIRKQVTSMAQRFIVGEDAKSAIKILKGLHKQNVAFTADLLGEAVLSQKESDDYINRYLDLIENLSKESSKWPAKDLIDSNHAGPIPRCNISLKLSAFAPQLDTLAHEQSVAKLCKRLKPIMLKAQENNVFLNFDMEDWALHDITMSVFKTLLLDKDLCEYPHFGIVIQAYLKSADNDFDFLLNLAKDRNCPVTIRLVKGAYWDFETTYAMQQGLDIPVYTSKPETDLSYERISKKMLENHQWISSAFASHNLRSLMHALVLADELKLNKKAFEIQMLYGMAESERKALIDRGYRVRVYAPVGEMIPGMAYLVRRLLENTSNQGFLRLSFHDNRNISDMLKKPEPDAGFEGLSDNVFKNMPPLDFHFGDIRRVIKNAVDDEIKSIPYKVPVVINGKEYFDDNLINHVNPSKYNEVISKVSYATIEQSEEAIAIAKKAYKHWRLKDLKERAELLEKIADKLEKDRLKLASMMIYEVAKPCHEADADVMEAIDFCRYYAQRARIELADNTQASMAGESNTLIYEGRGPSLIIAPWNFPLAILCGMATASIVAGNPVILKPAEQSSAIALEEFP